MKATFYIIGAGGVGSWLAPALCLLTKPSQVILMDGDKLEDKNLNRQLFTKADIGKNKAEALASRYGCQAQPYFYSAHFINHLKSDWLIVCADNHPARKAALQMCDDYGCRAIVACNEKTSAEAFYYQPDWAGTTLDPREYYPEILTDDTGDPRQRAIGCTGEAQVATPQLVTANMLAAGLAGHLIMVWALEAQKLDEETLAFLPFKLVANMSRLESFRVCDRYDSKLPKERTVEV